jgi:hypothetical protein
MLMSKRAQGRSRMLLPVLSTAVLIGGCALVELTPTGAGVRLASPDAVVTCTNLGRITASVVHEVGILPRHPEAVQDNINVTARNRAAELGADTIVPVTEVEDGKQTFEIYRCLRR